MSVFLLHLEVSSICFPGAMAGLAIGMLLIGAILGLLAAFIIYKRIDTSVPYQQQN